MEEVRDFPNVIPSTELREIISRIITYVNDGRTTSFGCKNSRTLNSSAEEAQEVLVVEFRKRRLRGTGQDPLR